MPLFDAFCFIIIKRGRLYFNFDHLHLNYFLVWVKKNKEKRRHHCDSNTTEEKLIEKLSLLSLSSTSIRKYTLKHMYIREAENKAKNNNNNNKIFSWSVDFNCDDWCELFVCERQINQIHSKDVYRLCPWCVYLYTYLSLSLFLLLCCSIW